MIETFIKRPVFTTMFILVLVVFGIRSYPELGVDLYPDVDLPLVGVTVTYEGTAPEEMETLITKPIENRVSQVSGIKTITSTIREGFSQTVLEFDIGVDPKAMASEVREKVATVRRRLPDDIDEPTVQNFDTSSQAIAAYTFASDVRPPQEVRRLVDDLVKDELQQLDGVAEASVVGSSSRAIKIHVLPEKLKAYGISVQTVLQQVNAANYNTPGGKIRDGQNTITVRTVGKFYSIDDFKQIVVANHNGRPVMLTDVADVEDTWEDEETYSRANGIPCVVVFVRKQSRTNTVEVVDRVNAALKELQANDLPPDIHVEITRDQSRYIRENVADVWNTILFGGFLALAITYLFLQDLRATIIGGLAIPTSIIATFYLMRLMDFTLNNMSLMGLSLAVGFLIDDAIVLVENVFRHIEMGKKPMAAAADATKELVLAILATSMSLMAVFVPIGSMGEVVGQYFKQFGLTVAFALAFSTMSAYTLTPMVSAHWLKDPTKKQEGSLRPPFIQWLLERFEAGFDALREAYDQLMKYAIHHPKKFIAASFATLLLNFALFPFLGIELQPVYDSGEFSVNVKAPPGTSLERMARLVQPLEQHIASMPEVRVAATRIGGVRTPVNEGGIDVKLYPASERKRGMQEIMRELRGEFSKVGEMQVSVVTNQGGGGGRGESRPVQIGLRGSDLEYLMHYANELADMIRGFPGATDVEIQGNDAEPEIVIRLDQLKASRVGLDNSAVGSVVQYAFQGKSTRNSYTIGNNDYDIILQVEKANRRTVDDVKNLRVSTSGGNFIRLGDIAEVTLESGPTRINREGRQRQIAVYADTVGTSPGDLLQKIKSDYIPALNMDIGYRAKMIGQSDMMSRIFGEVVKAIVLAIVLIYMVLAAEFESLSQPFIIMMSLPFAIIGAVLGLLVANQTANMMSVIGFTMLLGLVTKNAILLIDYANQARERGVGIRDAILEACSLRLRPILMTTLSTLLGMLPVALGIGEGAELRQSMGVVLIGGLTTSTLLTLVVVPLIYMLAEEYRERKAARDAES
ncbi:MAG: efflux RND transporter permease subunit [Selenomonadaceae bacterium]|nr:efflux RND transporter permease subunit [Selenomonadaceae bacterium]